VREREGDNGKGWRRKQKGDGRDRKGRAGMVPHFSDQSDIDY